ncbi:hypothetical protein IAU60_004740 [Kwoniella sp. DSM 27419]
MDKSNVIQLGPPLDTFQSQTRTQTSVANGNNNSQSSTGSGIAATSGQGLHTRSTAATETPSPPVLSVTPASPASSPTSADTDRLAKTAASPTNTFDMSEKEVQSSPAGSALPSSTQPLTTSEPAIMSESNANGEPSKRNSLTNLTRRLSVNDDGAKSSDLSEGKEGMTVPKSAATASSSAPRAAPSSSRPANSNTAQTTAHRRKKKRGGLMGFLAALGCVSADAVEDERQGNQARQATQKPGTQVTTAPVTTATAPGVTAGNTKAAETPVKADAAAQGDATRSTETTLVDPGANGDKPSERETKANEELVVAPAEPQTLPVDETAGMTSSAVQAPGGGSVLLGTPTRSHSQRQDSDLAATEAEPTSSGGYTDISNSEIQDESTGAVAEEGSEEYGLEDEYEDEEDRLIEQGGIGIPIDENGQPAPLLPPILKEHRGRKCLVLDLDETLLHSSFKSLPTADYIVPVEIESQIHNVYVIKRPGVDHFLKEMGKIYEVVVFTASLSKYADPVLDMLDSHRVVTHRLFRESCYNHKGNYVKDLSQLGRSIESSIIIDNSPASYIFHPNNAVPVSTWFNDPHDAELTDLCPFLTDLATVDDVRGVLDGRMM